MSSCDQRRVYLPRFKSPRQDRPVVGTVFRTKRTVFAAPTPGSDPPPVNLDRGPEMDLIPVDMNTLQPAQQGERRVPCTFHGKGAVLWTEDNMDLLSKVKALEQTYKSRTGKEDQPRHHAERIMQLKTKDERRAALELVPADVRHIVRFYVASEFAKRNKTPLPDLESV